MTKKFSNPLDQLIAQQPLRDIFRFFFDLSLVYINVDGNQVINIEEIHRLQSILHFEIFLGIAFKRRAYDAMRFKKVKASRRTLRSTLHGLYDLTVPVMQQDKVIGFLMIGPYRKEIPSRKHLEDLYHLLTGKKAHPLDSGFIQFVQVMLDTPMLNVRAEAIMIKLLKAVAGLFKDGAIAKQDLNLYKPSINALASELPHRYWLLSTIGPDPYQPPVRWNTDGELSDFEKNILGFEKLPNCVLAMFPRFSNEMVADPIGSLLLKNKLKEEVFQICRRWRKLNSGPFGGALVIVASVDGHPGSDEASLAANKLAKRFEKEILSRTGIEVMVAAGTVTAPGEPLIDSFESASKNVRGIMAHEGGLAQKEGEPSKIQLFESKRKLLLIASSLRSEELPMEGERFLGLALRVSRNDDELRFWIMATLSECLLSLSKYQPIDLESQISQWQLSLLRCGSASELTSMFRLLLLQVGSFLAKPREMMKQTRMVAALRTIDGAWQRPPRLQDLAQHHGYAVSAFSRAFKRHTGCGFHEYVRRRRLKEAEILLHEGRLNMTQISEYCGFSFLSQFDKAFHDHYGLYPKKWVEKNLGVTQKSSA